MSKRRKGFVAALGVMAGLAITSIAVPASAATGPDGFTILYASQAQGAHKCEVVGTRDQYGNEGVVCADLWTSSDGAGHYFVRGDVEAYCQNSANVVVECPSIESESQLTAGNGVSTRTPIFGCGGALAACPVGRWNDYTDGFEYTTNTGCASNPDSLNQVWNVALMGGTFIELPQSDKTVTPSANWSTGHYYICDNS
ncbi:MAG TPA: hypothetical protein VHT26_06310 [Trebonia sp.]|nr:hypothetical protein [Trebonia sp.]